MAHGYKIIQWTPFKKRYDLFLVLGVVLFLGAYLSAASLFQPIERQAHPVQLALRATGAGAFGLLTLILAIGPLARLSPRFLPLLYNRRHLGVTCFLLALSHAGLTLLWYHGFSDLNPLISIIASNPRYDSIAGFPFESLGLLALVILFVMAATSHDFWNSVLGPNMWKAIHMVVYWAYAFVIAHIMLGAVQGDKSPLYAITALSGAGLVGVLHVVAGAREARRDARAAALSSQGWIRVGALGEIADKCARVVVPPEGERIAVFRDGDKVHAVSNVCRHQGGPLGEGRIVDGCITCPWHGFQYRPEDGRSPPPFTEKIATYPTRLEGGVVFVSPKPVREERAL